MKFYRSLSFVRLRIFFFLRREKCDVARQIATFQHFPTSDVSSCTSRICIRERMEGGSFSFPRTATNTTKRQQSDFQCRFPGNFVRHVPNHWLTEVLDGDRSTPWGSPSEPVVFRFWMVGQGQHSTISLESDNFLSLSWSPRLGKLEYPWLYNHRRH